MISKTVLSSQFCLEREGKGMKERSLVTSSESSAAGVEEVATVFPGSMVLQESGTWLSGGATSFYGRPGLKI